MLRKEGDAITSFATAEAFVDAQIRGNIEGGCFLVVEWTQSQIPRTLPFQRNEFAHYFFYASSFFYFLNGVGRDHYRGVKLH